MESPAREFLKRASRKVDNSARAAIVSALLLNPLACTPPVSSPNHSTLPESTQHKETHNPFKGKTGTQEYQKFQNTGEFNKEKQNAINFIKKWVDKRLNPTSLEFDQEGSGIVTHKPHDKKPFKTPFVRGFAQNSSLFLEFTNAYDQNDNASASRISLNYRDFEDPQIQALVKKMPYIPKMDREALKETASLFFPSIPEDSVWFDSAIVYGGGMVIPTIETQYLDDGKTTTVQMTADLVA